MSIGQFVVQVTPIQIARAYAAIANGGYLVTPHLTKKDKENLSKVYTRYTNLMEIEG